jgi:hypothetical protein
MVEDNILSVSKAMFQNKNNWPLVTIDMKEKYFFIFNRYLSKKYPKEAQLINDKLINKSIGLDLWYYFMLDKPYPRWFWSKSKKSESEDISDKDYDLLMRKLNLNKSEDLTYLINNFSEVIEEELKFYKKQLNNG